MKPHSIRHTQSGRQLRAAMTAPTVVSFSACGNSRDRASWGDSKRVKLTPAAKSTAHDPRCGQAGVRPRECRALMFENIPTAKHSV